MPQQRDVWSVFAALAAVMAMVFALVAVAAAGDGDGVSMGTGAAGSAEVELVDYAIAPAELTVGPGAVLEVTNNGTVPHDLAIEGTDLATPQVDPGGSASLDLADLAAGTYTIFCMIPGHRQLGMEATLTIDDAAGAATGDGGHADAPAAEHRDWRKLDADMLASLEAFPAETEGRGGQVLEPVRIAPDGTKEFELTAAITDWEVEPGKIVQAWSYNGVVPGPTFEVAVGDKLRVTIHNELPISTDIHWHGLDTPWSQDGVAPLTQPFVEPGRSYTYEFSPQRPMVGMYHAHNHGFQGIPNGLLGAFLVGDMPVPAGVEVSQEIPMVLNDAGTIGFALNGKSWPATEPIVAALGETVMIHYMNEGLSAHPMHLHGMDQLVIAKDGHPLAQPYLADTVNVAPGERYTVLVTATNPGTWVYHCHIVTHAEREDGLFGMITAFVVQ